MKTSIISSLGFLEGTLPVKYLGLPLISTKMTYQDCAPLIKKVKKRINA